VVVDIGLVAGYILVKEAKKVYSDIVSAFVFIPVDPTGSLCRYEPLLLGQRHRWHVQ